MSEVTLDAVKRYLRVTQTSDDLLLQDLIDAAEDQCRQYVNRDALPNLGDPSCCTTTTATTTDGELAPSVRTAVCLLVQAHYEGADADAVEKARVTMQNLLAPYRCGLGA